MNKLDPSLVSFRDSFGESSRVQLSSISDFSRCRPVTLADGSLSFIKEHAKIGVRALTANPFFALFDEMGNMKTAQTIIAAQYLFINRVINRVIVFTPASVRPVWFDRELGELSKHLWLDLPSLITEYHDDIRQWTHGPKSDAQLRWIVTNYEYVARSKERTAEIAKYCTPGTFIVFDESAAIKAQKSLQTKMAMLLRNRCGRVALLNGTPIANTPLDLMPQGNVMHPSILECRYITMFRERYAVMANHNKFPHIIGWKNLDDLQRRFAPYVLRRLKKNCLDLPEKLPPVTLTARLTPKTWKVYKQMKDEMVAWLSNTSGSIALQAGTKALRLAQVTSGFIGGVDQIIEDDDSERPDWLPKTEYVREPSLNGPIHEIGREKLDLVMQFFREHVEADSTFKLLVWCRFRHEVYRMLKEVQFRFPQVESAILVGAQRKAEREQFLRLLNPQTSPNNAVFAIGTYGTGSLGHNFTAAHTVVNCSYDHSLFKFLQSADRVHRPGQLHAVSYFDVVAEGPAGQHTMDHGIIRARQNKQNVADLTASAWLDVLNESAA